jgi:hypothetical protein
MTTTVQPVVPAQRAGAVTRPNQYPGNCVDCGQRVEAQQGTLVRTFTGWKVRHPARCPDPEPAKTITATTPGVYRHDGRIWVVKPTRDKQRVYACELVESAPRATEAGTVIPFELVFRPRAIYDLAAAERMPLAEAEAITARYGRCIVCATPLKAAGSVKRGIGPVCRKLFASDAEER